MTRFIAIANEKGGVAKTTSTLSLGAAWADGGKSVLLIDMDPQASLTVSLNITHESIVGTIANLMTTSLPADKLILNSAVPNLDILPANLDLALSERLLVNHQSPTQLLQNTRYQFQEYDYVLMDCPPSLGLLTQNALAISDLLLIPVVPEFLAVTTLRDITQLIQKIRSGVNPHLSYRILFTIVDQRLKSHTEISHRFREKFLKAITTTEIQVDTRLRDASAAGVPIIHFAPQSRSASQYRMLAEELV
jgi:chromosome partitioning protein